MKGKKARRPFMLLFVVLMITVGKIIETQKIMNHDTLEVSKPNTTNIVTAIHDPITISSDDDFETQSWPGEGTDEKPYIIANLEINRTGSVGNCITIQNTRAHFKIENCIIVNATESNAAGIFLSNVTNAVISNVNCTNNYFGIALWNANSSLVNLSNCTANLAAGVYLYQSYNDNMTNVISNSMTGIGLKNGIVLQESHSCRVENSTFSFNSNGIYALSSTDCVFHNNTCGENDQVGIIIAGTSNAASNNTCYLNEKGLFFYAANHSSAYWNNFHDNSDGIFVELSGDIDIFDNLCDENDQSGINLLDCEDIELRNNSLYDNLYGVRTDSSHYCTLVNNSLISNNNMGFYIIDSNYNNITGNTGRVNTWHVVYLDDSDFNWVDNNTCNDCTLYDAIVIRRGSINNTISNNTIARNGRFGVHIWPAGERSDNNTITNNTFLENLGNGVYIQPGNHNNTIIWNSFIDDSVYDNGENNTFDWNYWSDYKGEDADWNGIGDTPYEIPGPSDAFDIHPLTTPPELPFYWHQYPVDQNVSPYIALHYDLNASSRFKGIDTWWLDDTIHFHIDTEGVVTNSTVLTEEVYTLEVFVNDTTGDILNAMFRVYVDLIPPYQHGPILIQSDSDLESQGWPGSGTLEDPYRIEQLDIDSEYTYDFCISISNTRAFIKISSCFLKDAISEEFYLFNVTNCIIEKNTIMNVGLGVGILIESCNDTAVFGNSITQCDLGLVIVDSINAQLVSNIVHFNTYGIISDNTNDTWIENNTCNNCDASVHLEVSYNSTLFNNTIFNNTYEGIIVHGCMLINLTKNSLITNGVGIGIYGEEISDDVFVTWNVFDENDFNAIDDMPALNCLFDYNYWSNYTGTDGNGDGFGDEKHPIDGYGNNNDTHPLFYRPSTPVWAVPLVEQVIEYGDALSYDLDIAVGIPVKQWWLEDTTYVQINSNGVVTNSTLIPVGSHEVDVWVENVYGLMTHGNFTVIVEDTIDPTFDEPPTDRLLDYNEPLSYKINASDLSGVIHFTVNDTVRFSISETGLLTNSTLLPVGTYGIEIIAYDPYNNYVSVTIAVKVFDVTIPEIDSPADIEYYEGDSGYEINWTPTDDNPVSYEITLDGEVVRSGLWNSSGEVISISVDNHTPGVYTYGLRVYDIGGNDWYDEVVVTVLAVTTTPTTPTTTFPTTTTTTTTTTTGTTTTETETTSSSTTTSLTTPADVLGLIISLSLIGFSAAVVVLIIMFMKKKKKS